MYWGGGHEALPPTNFSGGENCMELDGFSWRPNGRGLLQNISNKIIKIWGNGGHLKICKFYRKFHEISGKFQQSSEK